MESAGKKRSKGCKGARPKRKRKTSHSDEEGPAFLSSKYAEPPASKIYNSRFIKQAPAELFRKDLISAMKLPDSEPLTPDDYWLIEDSWKPEWERGVQVPVDPDALPEPSAVVFRKRIKSNFKLPKKFIRIDKDKDFSPADHFLSYMPALADQTCRYDMDDKDTHWLAIVNEDRDDFGLEPIDESVVEKILEEIESLCYDNMQEALRADPNLNLDSDEDAICDVCRSPDSEDGNEIVFCDACNICVHQSCYGITKIPEGSWICRTCTLSLRPSCLLCPNRGGAMKPTKSGEKWCHVSCAIWLPEVSIGCVEKMEPITKISHIPPYRWSVSCSICEDKAGACIQCSFKGCKSAYHVTCAFKVRLKMRAIMSDHDDDALKLKSYCSKHTKENALPSDADPDEVNEKEIEMTSEERQNTREHIIQEKESSFYEYAPFEEVVQLCPYEQDILELVYNYWKLKRKANLNQPLLQPREMSQVTPSIEGNSTYNFMKKMVTLRRDLERSRNLCYMITKREKVAKSWVKNRHEIFRKQMTILSDSSCKLSIEERNAVLLANSGDLAHDKMHTVSSGPTPDTLRVLNVLIGEENTKAQLNGILKMRKKNESTQLKKVTSNPYAKHYLNGLLKRSQRWLATADQHKWEEGDSAEEMSPMCKRERNVSGTSDQITSGDCIDVAKVNENASTSSVLPETPQCNTSNCEENIEPPPLPKILFPCSDLKMTIAEDSVLSADFESCAQESEEVAGHDSDKSDVIPSKPICNMSADDQNKVHRKTKRRKFLNTEVKKNLNEHEDVKKKIKKVRIKREAEDRFSLINGQCDDADKVEAESVEASLESLHSVLNVPVVNSEQDIVATVDDDAEHSQTESVILECFVHESLTDSPHSQKCQDEELDEVHNVLPIKDEICDIVQEVTEYPLCDFEVIVENNFDLDELSQNSAQGSEISVESNKASLLSGSPCADSESENLSSISMLKTERGKRLKKCEDRFRNHSSSRTNRKITSFPLRNKLMNNHVCSSSSSSVNKIQRTSASKDDNSVNNINDKQSESEIAKPKTENSLDEGSTDMAVKMIPRKGSLTGYKIPKKPRSNAVEDTTNVKHGSSPLTGLSPSSTSTSSSYTSANSYQTRPNKSFVTKDLMSKFDNNHKSHQKPVHNRDSRAANNSSQKSSSGNYQWRMMCSGEEVTLAEDHQRHFPLRGMPPYHSHHYPPPNHHLRQWIPGVVPNQQLRMPFVPNRNT